MFDASAREDDTGSLKRNLDPGPNLNQDILAVLLNLRLHPVALFTDAENAFTDHDPPGRQKRFALFVVRAPASGRSTVTYRRNVKEESGNVWNGA